MAVELSGCEISTLLSPVLNSEFAVSALAIGIQVDAAVGVMLPTEDPEVISQQLLAAQKFGRAYDFEIVGPHANENLTSYQTQFLQPHFLSSVHYPLTEVLKNKMSANPKYPLDVLQDEKLLDAHLLRAGEMGILGARVLYYDYAQKIIEGSENVNRSFFRCAFEGDDIYSKTFQITWLGIHIAIGAFVAATEGPAAALKLGSLAYFGSQALFLPTHRVTRFIHEDFVAKAWLHACNIKEGIDRSSLINKEFPYIRTEDPSSMLV